MTSGHSIQSRIIKLAAKHLSLKESDIKPESRFVEDLGADSLDLVELVMEIEEEFNIEIPDEDVEKMHRVNEVVNYCSKVVTGE